MLVKALTLNDFRSWRRVSMQLEPGATVFLGANGNGKTNLLEALGYVSTLSSHRVAGDAPLLRAGVSQATVSATVINLGRELTVDVELNGGAANRARINTSPVRRPREILGILQTVLFAPEDLSLVRGDPGERRRFLDELLTVRRPRMAAVRSDYERVLRQRSALLKTAGRSRDLSTLDVWDGHLATHGVALLAERLKLVDALEPYLVSAYASIAPGSRPAALRYRSTVPEPSEGAFLRELAAVRSKELERGVCLVGPHRDDLELILGDEPAKGFASHGESWSFALSLRLAAFELLRTDGSDPVLLLDDVFAELDRRRRAALAAVAAGAEQVLITAAVAEDVPEELAARRVGVQMIADAGGRHSVLEY